MTIIGIDMSKNSPGVCIRQDNKLKFISFLRGQNKGKISIHYKTVTDSGADIFFYEYQQPPKLEYSESEIWKTLDAARYAEWIVSHLPEHADFVGIEGFSYGSSGNSFIDIVGYGYAVRMAISKKYDNKFSVFSPGNVKKTAGKGNANKELMMEYFINTQNKDLQKCQFWKDLKSGKIDKVKKPVDDLCDSFFIQECTKIKYLENAV